MFLWLVLALGSNSPAVLFWARSRILCEQQDHPFDWAPLKEQEGLNWRWKQCCHFLSKQMHLLSRPSRSFRGAQSKRWFCCLNSTLDRAQKSTAGELEPSARTSQRNMYKNRFFPRVRFPGLDKGIWHINFNLQSKGFRMVLVSSLSGLFEGR